MFESLFELIEEYCTWKVLLVYILCNCALPWYGIWRNRRLIPKPSNEKFLPFWRQDMGSWSYLLCIFTHFFFLFRYMI